MEIIYHGHSCVQITSGENRLIIDPFLTGNPVAVAKPEHIQVQYILLTHGHPDHLGDTIEIAKNNDATVICAYEIAIYLARQGVKAEGMGIGGTYKLPFAYVSMTPAIHSSSIIEENNIIYAGLASGLVINLEGKTILHAGDTALFSDMKLIGDKFKPDLVFLPIGDLFTMGPDDAVQAAKWLEARLVVPVHYNSFPPLKQDGPAFIQKLESAGLKGAEWTIGQTYPF
jgi:L-ascorbate metabolism protein UlaG (beta-lactamase superfamily)